MNAIEAVFRVWMLHVILTLVMSSPVLFFFRKRAQWERRDLLALVVPFAFWVALMLTPLARGKTLGNALVEGVYIGIGVTVAALVRVWMGGVPHRRRYFAWLLGGICVVAIIAFFIAPPLPE